MLCFITSIPGRGQRRESLEEALDVEEWLLNGDTRFSLKVGSNYHQLCNTHNAYLERRRQGTTPKPRTVLVWTVRIHFLQPCLGVQTVYFVALSKPGRGGRVQCTGSRLLLCLHLFRQFTHSRRQQIGLLAEHLVGNGAGGKVRLLISVGCLSFCGQLLHSTFLPPMPAFSNTCSVQCTEVGGREGGISGILSCTSILRCLTKNRTPANEFTSLWGLADHRVKCLAVHADRLMVLLVLLCPEFPLRPAVKGFHGYLALPASVRFFLAFIDNPHPACLYLTIQLSVFEQRILSASVSLHLFPLLSLKHVAPCHCPSPVSVDQFSLVTFLLTTIPMNVMLTTHLIWPSGPNLAQR
ncbi:hypothetical protein BaRGS_00014875 [Batillaria attramentaria]|uniref:Uncharacterized protein n=1 Tax=Batillaria attramentaria TaxID=370345 RepID=A0ABD0L3V9_9CAEN